MVIAPVRVRAVESVRLMAPAVSVNGPMVAMTLEALLKSAPPTEEPVRVAAVMVAALAVMVPAEFSVVVWPLSLTAPVKVKFPVLVDRVNGPEPTVRPPVTEAVSLSLKSIPPAPVLVKAPNVPTRLLAPEKFAPPAEEPVSILALMVADPPLIAPPAFRVRVWPVLSMAPVRVRPVLSSRATFPAVSRWVKTTPEGVSWLGFFYGGNIAGAVFGCLLAGFYLLRAHDSEVTTFVAAGINATCR